MPRQGRKKVYTNKGGRLFDVEAALLDEGREDIRAGRCISGEAADEWLDRLDGDQEPQGPDDVPTPR